MRELLRRLKPDGETAHKLRRFNQQSGESGKPPSVKSLAEALGLAVLERPLSAGHNGKLVRDLYSPSGFAAVINLRLGVRAKRYALMHEIGHFLLHAEQDDMFGEFNFDLSGSTEYWSPAEETEANQFADVMFFGDGALASARAPCGNDLVKLSKLFGVTDKQMQIAMKRF
jgi:Zn-dependent peptidase ImmA (M78 family)